MDRRKWFNIEYIKGGSAQLAAAQCSKQCFFIDDWTTADVDQYCGRFQPTDLFRADRLIAIEHRILVTLIDVEGLAAVAVGASVSNK